ncbi:MAG TPA: Rrf2 family transcriptional regulator [Ghiorsea sp.]|nr:Rrf2 family transcriptional regulator [Ghiorsea sp.]HIP06599.1 Rrf2 family transcriptional regulator [Mariprofundaceae bacterium]
MQLTSRGRYAVSAMVDLAKHQDDGPITLASISERQFISLSYLEQLFRKLRENDLVTSVRGPGGGYTLAKEPKDITISLIMRAVNEEIQTTLCKSEEVGCHRGSRCETHNLWTALGQHIRFFLETVTIQDVCDDKDYMGTLKAVEKTLM